MFSLVAKLYSEDISKKDFCEREAINYHTFLYWIRRYRSFDGLLKNEMTSKEDASPNKFIPIEIGTSIDSVDSAITIAYPNGVRLHLDAFSLTKQTIVCLQQLISCLD